VTFYGGNLVAESVASCNQELIAAAPDLLREVMELREATHRSQAAASDDLTNIDRLRTGAIQVEPPFDNEDVLAEIEALETDYRRLQDATRWIPVEERLPTPATHVLVIVRVTRPEGQYYYWQDGYLDMCGAWRSAGDCRYLEQHSSYRVTHWRPAPELPAVEVNGG